MIIVHRIKHTRLSFTQAHVRKFDTLQKYLLERRKVTKSFDLNQFILMTEH